MLSEGHPVENARVQIDIVNNFFKEPACPVIGVTDAAGRFVTSRLRPGQFKVTAQAALNDGELYVELAESPRQLVQINLEPVVQVNVRVVDEHDGPAPKARVTSDRSGELRADEHGELVLRFAPGEHWLRASASGHADSEVAHIAPDAGTVNVLLRLRASFPILGRVLAPNNERMRWLSISIHTDGGTRCDEPRFFDVDATGRFRIDTPSPGPYSLCGETNTGSFEPVVVTAPGSVDLTLKSLPPEARPVKVSGNSEPLPDLPSGRSREVTLRAPDIDEATVLLMEGPRTNSRLLATLKGPPNTIRVLCPVERACLVVTNSRSVGRVCLPPSDDAMELEVLLRNGASVSGFANRRGKPASGVTAQLSGPSERSTVTDSEGEFIFDGLAPGSYSLRLGDRVIFENLSLEVGNGMHFPVVDIDGSEEPD